MIYAGILAGGIGSRMNISNMPKQFLNIGNKPIIIHTIEKFLLCNKIDKIYVGVNPDWNSYLVDMIEKDYNYLTDKIEIIDGGKDRNSTIINIIDAIKSSNKNISDEDIIITHDAVRPFVSIKMIEENIAGCTEHNIVDTVVPAFDTIVVSEDGEFISSIPDRKKMYQGQTPQTFRINKFMNYYNNLSDEQKNILTDACKIFVLNEEKVFLVEGDFSNIKITTVTDLKIAKAMIMENCDD